MKLKNQNILFIARTMGLGGTENVVLQLCEIFLGRVNKIIVCSSGGVHEDELHKMGIKHYIIPDIASKNPSDMLKCYFTIKAIVKKEDITVIHSHHRMAAFYAELIAPKKVIKIANAHNTFYNKRKLTQFAYKNTQLIAVGEMVKKNLVEYFGIENNQICVIHNAVKEFMEDINPIEILKTERAKGHILIGNIGRLSEQKGMKYFIEAAKVTEGKHPEARFVIVGDGEDKEQLQEQVESLNLQDKVIFLGYRNDIQNVMKQLDFIVLSSLWEGLPLTPIEAFSVGKTVIGTAVDGTPEIIRDNIDGYLIESRDTIALADKMNYLCEHLDKRKGMEAEAHMRYIDKFSFKKLGDAYLLFYKNII